MYRYGVALLGCELVDERLNGPSIIRRRERLTRSRLTHVSGVRGPMWMADISTRRGGVRRIGCVGEPLDVIGTRSIALGSAHGSRVPMCESSSNLGRARSARFVLGELPIDVHLRVHERAHVRARSGNLAPAICGLCAQQLECGENIVEVEADEVDCPRDGVLGRDGGGDKGALDRRSVGFTPCSSAVLLLLDITNSLVLSYIQVAPVQPILRNRLHGCN
jgi:hypothetical protein